LVYQQNGLIDMAMDALKRAIYFDRSFVLAHYNLAQVYLFWSDEVAARKSLQNVMTLLEGKPKEELVPEGDGLVVGRLQELVQSALNESVGKTRER
jgi:chemotaxis protein methyltransferase CheR